MTYYLTSDDYGKTWTYDEKYNLALTWANTWVTRDGKPRYEIMSAAMQSRFRTQQQQNNGDPNNFCYPLVKPLGYRF